MRALVPLIALVACAPAPTPLATGSATADGWRLSESATLSTAVQGAPSVASCGDACTRWTWATPQGETWWESVAGQTHQGWRLDRGPARVDVSAPGAAVTQVGPTALRFIADGTLWSWRGVAAWDATGRSLPVHLKARDQAWSVEVDDAGAAWPITVDPLLQREAFLIFGAAEDHLGVAVSSAGDVDADGYTDLMASAPDAPMGGVQRGNIRLYIGQAGGVAPIPSIQVIGGTDRDQNGAVMLATGDVNGDLHDDVLFGFRGGTALPYRGADHAGPYLAVFPESFDDVLDSGGGTGGGTQGAHGDFDDDGLEDLAIGSPDAATNGLVKLFESDGAHFVAAATVVGDAVAGRFGAAMAAGDTNGDGFDDLVVSAPDAEASGLAHAGIVSLYLGSATGLSSTPYLTWEGDAVDARLGAAVAVGDLDGDGQAEVVFTQTDATDPAGRGTIHTYSYATAAETVLTGTEDGAHWGSCVAVLRDTDGDGFGDLVATSADADGWRLWHGSATGPGATPDRFDGLARFGRTNRACAGLDDVDGDGLGDLVVSDSEFSLAPTPHTGLVAVYLSRDVAAVTDADADGVSVDVDCNDDDGQIGAAATVHPDLDADGHGDHATSITTCLPPGGWLLSGDDCDDGNPAVVPGATEVCDGVDNDCDGTVDQAPTDGVLRHRDADADGHGAIEETSACADDPTFVDVGDDCDDANANAYPGATEVCDGADNNCDGNTDVGASDTVVVHRDADGDGYGVGNGSVDIQCPGTPGYVANSDDCDDANASVSPVGVEVCDNGVDEDCSGADQACPADTDLPADTDVAGDSDLAADTDLDTDTDLYGDTDAGEVPTAGGCGCATEPPSGAGLWAVAAALAGLRRRRR